MELLRIPDGTIRPNVLEFEVLDNPTHVFNLLAMGVAYNDWAGTLGIVGEQMCLGLRVGEARIECALKFLDLPRRTLVVVLDDVQSNTVTYLLLRAGQTNGPWEVSTELLVLPFESPSEWQSDDAELNNHRYGRVLLYVALATMNGSFRPLTDQECAFTAT